jgi:Putative Ig domain
MILARCFIIFLGIIAAAQLVSAQATGFAITTTSFPDAIIDRAYSAMIQTSGGTPPLTRQIVEGSLPPGLGLEATTGVITGTPTEAGVYSFKVTVTDSADRSVSGEFTIRVLDYLVVEWRNPPSLTENTISGTLEVANYSKDTFDLTVIVVAVNEIGKAFALGYQRFNLPPSGQQVIPFSSSLPNGEYVVHADAIAEISTRLRIYRKHMETEQPITVNVNR